MKAIIKGPRRNTAYYAEIIARERGLPLEVVHNTLMFFMSNMERVFLEGDELYLSGTGTLCRSVLIPRPKRKHKQSRPWPWDKTETTDGTDSDHTGPERVRQDDEPAQP